MRPILSLFAIAGVRAFPGHLIHESRWVGAGNARDIAFEARYGGTYAIPQRSWAEARSLAETLVANMTLDEKANMTAGTGYGNIPCAGNTGSVERLGIPSFCYQDGPLGVRPVDGVTAFPAGVTTASTWDRELIYARAVALGQEFFDKGVNVALGPCMGPLGRSALGGRNWEGFSADPYLAGVASYLSVAGMQSSGVIATAKHWLANEQESYRQPASGYSYSTLLPFNNTVSVNEVVDDRTLHELYMWPFVEAIRAGVGAVMCSYNRNNGEYSCQNKETLTNVLRGELNFPGLIVSDWFATHDTELSSASGLDVEMPSGNLTTNGSPAMYLGEKLAQAIRNGSIAESRLDRMAIATLTTMLKFGHDNPSYPKTNFNQSGLDGNQHVNVQSDHYRVALQVATDGIVLLKNTGSLPLKINQSLSVFGSDAGQSDGTYDQNLGIFPANSTNNGTNALGSGSGWARYPYLISPLAALQSKARSNGGWVRFFNNDFDVGDAYGLMATSAAYTDACLVFVSATAGEGFDRANTSLVDEGDRLIRHIADNCANTIVIMHVVGQVNMGEWNDHPNVTAILNANLPGQESGNAIAAVLYGDTNPSGKLVYTIAKNESDYVPVVRELRDNVTVEFTEKLEIDYRAFDARNQSVQYEFGFGLSYTKWSYSGLSLSKASGLTPSAYNESLNIGGNSSLQEYVLAASATVRNVGSVAGHEVAQLYVAFPETAAEPPKILRGFDKVKNVAPGSSQKAQFKLTRKDLSIWDSESKSWDIVEGVYQILVGKSSRKIELSARARYSGGSWTILDS